MSDKGALQVSEQERLAVYDSVWDTGELVATIVSFNDLIVNAASNETIAEFVRGKIRSTVNDPDVAETLCPVDFPLGTKRLCLDTNYYETYNLPQVRLVDLRKTPITTIIAGI